VRKSSKIDWFGFAVQFVFGAALGAALGFRWWSRSSYNLSPSLIPGILFMGGGAIVFGVIVGCLRDDFWRGFRESSWWRFW
jgi:hypothetical protein